VTTRGPIDALTSRAAELRGLLDETGVLLVRGGTVDPGALARFTSAFMARPLVYGGMRVRVSEDDHVQLAESGQQAIGLHAEMAYTPVRPDLCVFACERPASANGETTIGDGVAILRDIPTNIVEELERKRIKYVRTYQAAHWQRMFGVSELSQLEPVLKVMTGFDYAVGPSGELFSAFTTDPVVDGPGGRAFANSLNNIAGFGNPRGFYSVYGDDSDLTAETRAVLDRVHVAHTRAVAWEPGDVLMIDNWRVLHGRTAFEDPGRRILAMFGYSRPRG
jgi:alpha-ketoglutarate-dependent taurine dioxygenase